MCLLNKQTDTWWVPVTLLAIDFIFSEFWNANLTQTELPLISWTIWVSLYKMVIFWSCFRTGHLMFEMYDVFFSDIADYNFVHVVLCVTAWDLVLSLVLGQQYGPFRTVWMCWQLTWHAYRPNWRRSERGRQQRWTPQLPLFSESCSPLLWWEHSCKQGQPKNCLWIKEIALFRKCSYMFHLFL
jgi:hypothetical protein